MTIKNSDMQFMMKIHVNSKHGQGQQYQRPSYKFQETKQASFVPILEASLIPNELSKSKNSLPSPSSTTVYSFTTGTTFTPSHFPLSNDTNSRSSSFDSSPPSSPTSSTSSAPGSPSTQSLKRPPATFFATSFTFKPIDESDTEEVTCEFCGKMYKHRNCLSKHQWEHHEHWETTKRLCVSKHQQVQLLEAATVLVNITSDSQITVL